MKKILKMLGVAIFAFVVLGCNKKQTVKLSTEPCPESDFTFELNSDLTEVTITGYKGLRRDLVFPSTIQGVPVVQIGKGPIYEGLSVQMNRNSIDRPSDGRGGVTSIIVPEGVKKLGAWVFSYDVNVEVIQLPESLEEIGESAFEYCSVLKEIRIPSKIKKIPPNAFFDCSKLEKVILPEGLEIIDIAAFGKAGMYIYNPEKEVEFQINFPSSLKTINDEAFRDCKNLKIATLNEGLEYIGHEAFSNCSKLTSVTLPTSLKTIYEESFKSCTKIEEINFSDLSKCKGYSEFWGRTSGKKIKLVDLFKSSSKVKGSILLQKELQYEIPEGTKVEAAAYTKRHDANKSYYKMSW